MLVVAAWRCGMGDIGPSSTEAMERLRAHLTDATRRSIGEPVPPLRPLAREARTTP